MMESKRISIPQAVKSYPILAAAASFIYAGMGQVLCGKINRGGFLLVIGTLVSWIGNFVYAVFSLLEIPTGGEWQFVYYIGLIIGLLFRVWAVYDAYRIAVDLRIVE